MDSAFNPKKLSVVIPCYNEAGTISQVVESVKAADASGLQLEIIVVDDGSKDNTHDVLKTLTGIKVIRHERNRGKGGAIKSGFQAASGDIMLIQDADLEYDPADYKTILAPLIDGRADAVIGSRFAYERPRFFFGPRRSPFFTHYIGNIMIITLTNLLYGNHATDYEGAYKAFRRDVIAEIPIDAEGFEYDNELVCKLLRLRRRIVEAPISYKPRNYESGKKIKWHNGVIMLWTILKWRFKSFQPS